MEDLNAGGDVDDAALDQVEVREVDDADLVGADAAGGEGRDIDVEPGVRSGTRPEAPRPRPSTLPMRRVPALVLSNRMSREPV